MVSSIDAPETDNTFESFQATAQAGIGTFHLWSQCRWTLAEVVKDKALRIECSAAAHIYDCVLPPMNIKNFTVAQFVSAVQNAPGGMERTVIKV